ncbi:unnamed protein product, partial [Ixodes pacificus]
SDTATQFTAGDCAHLIAYCTSCIFIAAVVVVVTIFLLSYFEPSKPSRPRVNYTQLLFDSLDRSIEPCDNFYKFVCSGWMRNHQEDYSSLIDALEADTILDAIEALEAVPLPKEVTDSSRHKGTSGTSRGAPETPAANALTKKDISIIRDSMEPLNITYLYRGEALAQMKAEISAVHKAAYFYTSCKNIFAQSKIEKAHLKNFLGAYIKFPTVEVLDVSTIVRRLVELSLTWKVHVLFVVDVFADHDADAKPTVSLSPNIELETWLQLMNTLQETGKLREFMLSHLESIVDVASSNADSLLKPIIEANIDIILFLRSDEGSIQAPTYDALPHIIKGTTATTWLNAVNSQTQASFNVTHTDHLKVSNEGYFNKVGKLLIDQRRVERLSLFLGWHMVRQLAPLVTYKAVEVLYHDEKDLRQACFHRVMEVMPLTVIHPLLKLMPAPEALVITETMVSDIRAALEWVFDRVPWMDVSTKKAALAKLAAMKQILLKPGFIKDTQGLDDYYSRFALYPDFFTTNMEAARVATGLKLKTLAEGEVAENYAFEPLQLNAFYEGPLNTMFIPIGIIRPPFANENLSWPFNFAGLGAVVGHEIMHGFDTRGKDRDADGKHKDWWSPDVKKAYDGKVGCLENAYKTNVLEENVADFASLPAVLKASKERSSAAGSGLFNEFTPVQQFFLNYCFKLCARTTEGAVGYATDEDRCNVPLRHLDNFAAAFKCEGHAAISPTEKCNFWDLPV